MNVEIGIEAAQFPEKEYINGIFVALCGIFKQWEFKLWEVISLSAGYVQLHVSYMPRNHIKAGHRIAWSRL